MASGLAMRRINRPDTWLHRPVEHTKKILAKTEPSIHGPNPKSNIDFMMSVLDGEADVDPPARSACN